MSDGTRFIEFEACDKGNYVSNAPCYGLEGLSSSVINSGQVHPITPKPNDTFYPGQYVITLKLDERWDSCYTPHGGGFVKNIAYNNRLMFSKGFILHVYKEDDVERVGIKYIKVAIKQDA